MARKMLKQAVMVGALLLVVAAQAYAHLQPGSDTATAHADPVPYLPQSGEYQEAYNDAYASYLIKKADVESWGWTVVYNGNDEGYTTAGGQYEAWVRIYFYWY